MIEMDRVEGAPMSRGPGISNRLTRSVEGPNSARSNHALVFSIARRISEKTGDVVLTSSNSGSTLKRRPAYRQTAPQLGIWCSCDPSLVFL